MKPLHAIEHKQAEKYNLQLFFLPVYSKILFVDEKFIDLGA